MEEKKIERLYALPERAKKIMRAESAAALVQAIFMLEN